MKDEGEDEENFGFWILDFELEEGWLPNGLRAEATSVTPYQRDFLRDRQNFLLTFSTRTRTSESEDGWDMGEELRRKTSRHKRQEKNGGLDSG